MLFAFILILLGLLPFALHSILAAATAALPQGFYDALNFLFSIPRTLDGLFPIMIPLTQATIVLLFAWIGSKLWQIVVALSHFMPNWLVGNGKHPKDAKER